MDVCHNCGQRWPLYKRVCPACNHPEGATEREAKAFLRGQEHMRELAVKACDERKLELADRADTAENENRYDDENVLTERAIEAASCSQAISGLPIEGDAERKTYSAPAIEHTEDL